MNRNVYPFPTHVRFDSLRELLRLTDENETVKKYGQYMRYNKRKTKGNKKR